jgi:hypothetical protein
MKSSTLKRKAEIMGSRWLEKQTVEQKTEERDDLGGNRSSANSRLYIYHGRVINFWINFELIIVQITSDSHQGPAISSSWAPI